MKLRNVKIACRMSVSVLDEIQEINNADTKRGMLSQGSKVDLDLWSHDNSSKMISPINIDKLCVTFEKDWAKIWVSISCQEGFTVKFIKANLHLWSCKPKFISLNKSDQNYNFNHTSWVAVFTPTDRPQTVYNHCANELVGGVFVVSLCCFDIFVDKGNIVICLSHISFFFSWL